MSAHWYHRSEGGVVTLFDEKHPRWGRMPGWPKNKDGSPKKRINDAVRLQLGLYPSVTTILRAVGDDAGLLDWCGGLGIQAGMECQTLEGAKGKYKQLRDEAADRGTKFHKAIEVYLTTGEIPEDLAMKNACLGVDKLGLDGKKEWAWAGEVLFMRYAGTIDHHSATRLDDFKTTTKKRKPYEHEVAQAAAYGRAVFGNEYEEKAISNVYILQETGEVYDVVTWTPEQLRWGLQLFCLAYTVFHHLLKWGDVK